jgi:hypothetical protein
MLLTLVGRQPDMESKSGEGALMPLWPVRVLVPYWSTCRMVLVGNLGKGNLYAPDGHVESSKSVAAAGLAVMPTRQPLSSSSGEPRLVASKLAT